jgi:hypothetical protein
MKTAAAQRMEGNRMSERDYAKTLIDKIPDGRLYYVIAYLQGAMVPDETPNAETLAAFAELDSGGGHHFSGSTDALFSELR